MVPVLAYTIYCPSPCLTLKDNSSVCDGQVRNMNTCLLNACTCLSFSFLQPKPTDLKPLLQFPLQLPLQLLVINEYGNTGDGDPGGERGE